MKKTNTMKKAITKTQVKNKEFAKAYIKEKRNGTKAYQRVATKTLVPAVAAVGATRMLKRENVLSEIARILDSKGLTKDYLSEKLEQGTQATKQYVHDGRMLDTEHPDHTVRHKYIETSLKLQGELTSDKSGDTNIQINMVIDER